MVKKISQGGFIYSTRETYQPISGYMLRKITTKINKRRNNGNIVQRMNTTLLGFPYIF